MTGMYVLQGKEFSMRKTIEVITMYENFVFAMIRHPKCWNLKDRPITMPREQFEKEYKPARHWRTA
jgi:hypothetical protein